MKYKSNVHQTVSVFGIKVDGLQRKILLIIKDGNFYHKRQEIYGRNVIKNIGRRIKTLKIRKETKYFLII